MIVARHLALRADWISENERPSSKRAQVQRETDFVMPRIYFSISAAKGSPCLCRYRLDGSGYHRYAKGNDLSPAARILAAAEAFQTAREARPYRAALIDVTAAAKLRAAVREGKLCTEAVEAVLTAAGQPARRASAERLGGLTPREIEVLRLIAAGSTAKEAARQLDIAPKTADNHIQSLYSKIGVKTRAGAALFALERGLVN